MSTNTPRRRTGLILNTQAAPAAASHLPLHQLQDGESGVIQRIDVDGRIKRRLVEMGITPGTLVTLTKRAPLGDPIEISLRGYTLTLRTDDAQRIEVTPARRGEGR